MILCIKNLLISPHMSGREQHYISEAFRSNWIAPLGPLVNSFEEQLAERVGVKAAAAVGSGTAAIHLALRLLEVKEGDSVFCQSFTFVATANPILYEKRCPSLLILSLIRGICRRQPLKEHWRKRKETEHCQKR